MVRTKANYVPGAYRKVVASRAPRKVLGSSTFVTNSSSCSSRKAENKYAGGNPVCVRPTPKWQKGIGEFFRLSPKDPEKENQVPEEAGCSGLGTSKRKASDQITPNIGPSGTCKSSVTRKTTRSSHLLIPLVLVKQKIPRSSDWTALKIISRVN
ncbi:PCNA-associated factor isoform X1 [Alexandromys fortis]|uniref:PCNA-associated factor isoform X1 n=1 Tax=Alexandromys fortis TaxID=100897 RepID=UPI002152C1DD|nr:PCNA-associated factor isoform X1 [Microtus fortis]